MLDRLKTEQRNRDSAGIDQMSSRQIVALMSSEDQLAPAAVARESRNIAAAMDAIVERLRGGGRLIYLGAGTSGRLGVLDASECPPTFNTPLGQVLGIIAGGQAALTQSIEGAEDRDADGRRDLEAVDLSASDAVVGIATSGRTPYVLGGLRYAREVGAATIGLCCTDDPELREAAELVIAPIVGPEVITGSTRLKAGTATKLVLNMLSTGAMVQLGKTFGNYMVDLKAVNTKLLDRARRIVQELTGLNETQASAALQQCNGEVKTAIAAYFLHVSPAEGRRILRAHQGRLRGAITSVKSPSEGNRPDPEVS